MTLSMTGFGRKEVDINGIVVSIELKTLNTKYFDISFKIPSELKSKEVELRQFLTKEIMRGKADFSIYFTNSGNTSASQLNKSMLKLYLNQLKDFLAENNASVTDDKLIPHLIRLPEVFTTDNAFWEEHWHEIMQNVEQVVQITRDFRAQEGLILEKDMAERVNVIAQLLEQVTPHEKERITSQRSRLQDLFAQVGSHNKDRFEQEMIYYLERLDISEEKVRLKAHCDYFLELMGDDDYIKSKRLNFVAQEMGREINTLGSKANHAEIQKLVILMKNELEKIKEQVLNIV